MNERKRAPQRGLRVPWRVRRAHGVMGDRRAARAVAFVLGAPLLVAGLSACGGASQRLEVAAVDVTPEMVHEVTFTAQGRTATMKLDDGLWTPGPGATVQAATMLTTTADRLFPFLTYRIMTDVNQADPAYGFAAPNSSTPECGAVCAVKVSTKGRTWNLTVGAATFNKAGFYAKVDGDPRTFLITQKEVSDIISEATGLDFEFPESEKYRKIDAALNDENSARATTFEFDPYLVQVLASQEADESEKAGRGRGYYVLNAATSTKGQLGARDSKSANGADSGPMTPQAGEGQ